MIMMVRIILSAELGYRKAYDKFYLEPIWNLSVVM